jgi:mannitol-1-phosphate/altronate dehydrogenase
MHQKEINTYKASFVVAIHQKENIQPYIQRKIRIIYTRHSIRKPNNMHQKETIQPYIQRKIRIMYTRHSIRKPYNHTSKGKHTTIHPKENQNHVYKA